jgi:hypothetical protein
MRSLIILEVEHGEDIDQLAGLAEYMLTSPTDHDLTVLNYTVRVDLPPCFKLED